MFEYILWLKLCRWGQGKIILYQFSTVTTPFPPVQCSCFIKVINSSTIPLLFGGKGGGSILYHWFGTLPLKIIQDPPMHWTVNKSRFLLYSHLTCFYIRSSIICHFVFIQRIHDILRFINVIIVWKYTVSRFEQPIELWTHL